MPLSEIPHYPAYGAADQYGSVMMTSPFSKRGLIALGPCEILYRFNTATSTPTHQLVEISEIVLDDPEVVNSCWGEKAFASQPDAGHGVF